MNARAVMCTATMAALASVAVSVAAFGTAGAGGNGTPALRPFEANYAVNWKGMNAGTTTLTLERDGDDHYKYESRATAKGIFRIAFSDEIRQTSWFALVDGRVVPMRYRADDGSDDTERDIALDFDWGSGHASGVAEDRKVEVDLPSGAQDAMSIQAAHLLDLGKGEESMTYSMVDKDRVKQYRYRLEGKARLKTALGEIDTVIYRAERAGSKRTTRTWHAPSLGYLPVRGERLRDGKREFLMEIRSLERP